MNNSKCAWNSKIAKQPSIKKIYLVLLNKQTTLVASKQHYIDNITQLNTLFLFILNLKPKMNKKNWMSQSYKS